MPRSDGGSSDWSLVSGKVRPGEEVGTQMEVTQTPSALSGGAAPSGPSGGFLAQARIQAARASRAFQGVDPLYTSLPEDPEVPALLP